MDPTHQTRWFHFLNCLASDGTEIAAADFNGDGNVDWMDLAIWEGAYGLSNAADADDDNDSDGTDFLMWQRQRDGNPAAVTSVPEPASGVLIATALLSMALLRGRKLCL